MLVNTLGGFARLLNLGVGRALSKHVSELHWQGRQVIIPRAFETAIAISLLAGTAGCALLAGFRQRVGAALFHAGPGSRQFTDFALLVTGLGLSYPSFWT